MNEMYEYYVREWLKMAQKDSDNHKELVGMWERAQIGFCCAAIISQIVGMIAFRMGWIYPITGSICGIILLGFSWGLQIDKLACSKRWLEYRDFSLRMADKFKQIGWKQ